MSFYSLLLKPNKARPRSSFSTFHCLGVLPFFPELDSIARLPFIRSVSGFRDSSFGRNIFDIRLLWPNILFVGFEWFRCFFRMRTPRVCFSPILFVLCTFCGTSLLPCSAVMFLCWCFNAYCTLTIGETSPTFPDI